MKKRILSLMLVLMLVLSVVPAITPFAVAATAIYNPGDIAVINSIIVNNNLKWTPAPADGSSCPSDWYEDIRWTADEENKRIKRLYLDDKGLTGALDVSGLTALEWLECNDNQLTALDVSKNFELAFLYCRENELTALDVSKNAALEYLHCRENKLTALDVNRNTSLHSLDAAYNRLTSINLRSNSALMFLECGDNLLTTLDVSENLALISIRCGQNELMTALDISKNTMLQSLYCDNMKLKSLDVSKNPALNALGCGFNELTALDVSKNPELTYLYCSWNELTSLNVSKNPALTTLDCGFNELTALDVSKNPALTTLGCAGNLFSTVNTSHNPSLIEFIIDDYGVRKRIDNNRAVYNSKRTDRAALDYYRQVEADEHFTSLAKSITEGLTDDYSKAKAIYTWVANNVWYDLDLYFYGLGTTEPLPPGVYALEVCAGYASLTLGLLRVSGISAKFTTGSSAGTPHAWNEAYADGRWIIMDTTWGSYNSLFEGVYSPQEPCTYKYFDIPIKSLPHVLSDYGEEFLPPIPPNPLTTAHDWAREGITSALSKGFVPADLQDKYTSTITRAEFCRMALKWLEYRTDKSVDTLLAEKGASRNPSAFSDTTDSDILAAYALGITSGTKAPTATSPGTFTPNGEFSREQAATMILNTCKAAGMDVSNIKSAGFTDIGTASSWAVDAINFCNNNGFMNGTSASPKMFSPKTAYTREQSIMTFDNIK